MQDDATILFAHVEPGPLCTIKDLSNALTRSGIDYPTANARVAIYAKKNLIHVREKGPGATSPNMFSASDMAAAMLLSALQDMGVADHDVLSRVSAGIYSWPNGAKATTPHPTLAALIESIRDSGMWQLQVDFYRHLVTRERRIDATLYRVGEIDPNAPTLDSEALRRLKVEHPDLKADEDPRDPASAYWPVGSLIVPAFASLSALHDVPQVSEIVRAGDHG